MKKLLALVLALALALSLAACGSEAPASSSAAPAEEANTSAAEDAALTIEDVWPAGTTVTIDVPAKAGGGTDLYTRYATQAMGELLPGVNFVVNNYETSEVGMMHTVDADPDGLTLAVGHGGAFIQYLCGSSEVNATEDLAVVGILNAGGPQAIIARPDAPYKNFKEWGEWVQANPGEGVVGCSLGGASQVVLYTTLNACSDGHADDVNWVQCSSEADKLTQTASGSIDVANCSLPNAQAYEADGKLTILGVTGPAVCTLENMSELVGLELGESFKTTKEQGFDYSYDSNYYFWAPAGTPENVLEAINSVLVQLPDVESFAEGCAAMGSYACKADLATAREMQAAEFAMQDDTVTKMGLKVR